MKNSNQNNPLILIVLILIILLLNNNNRWMRISSTTAKAADNNELESSLTIEQQQEELKPYYQRIAYSTTSVPPKAISSKLGHSVSCIGDFNGDGLTDFAMSAPYYDSDKGTVYIFFGTPFSNDEQQGEEEDDYIFHLNETDPNELNGKNGIQIVSTSVDGSGLGTTISGGCDINNDGYDDLIIGTNYKSTAYALLGTNKASFWLTHRIIDVSLFSNSTTYNNDGGGGDEEEEEEIIGVTIRVSGSTDVSFGSVVSCVGDMNGDGIDDFTISSPSGDTSVNLGKVYLIYGKANTSSLIGGGGGSGSSIIDLSTTLEIPGDDGIVFIATEQFGQLGQSVDAAGDINDDGFNDLIIGEGYNTPPTFNGAAHVVFGKASTQTTTISLPVSDANDGIHIIGEADSGYFGSCVKGIGDFTGDGVDDIAIGEPGAATVYLVFGKPQPGGGGTWNLPLSTSDIIAAATTGIKVRGNDWSGKAISHGKMNGDSMSDVIIGSPNDNSGGGGDVYVVYGTSAPASVDCLVVSTADGTTWSHINTSNSGGGSAAADLGMSIATIKGFNGVGITSIIIGAPRQASSNGAVWVVYGSKCEIGGGTAEGKCTQCISGYGVDVESGNCSYCGGGNTFSDGTTACRPCSESDSGGITCKTCSNLDGTCYSCFGGSGYQEDGHQCIPCVDGYSDGTQPCRNCTNGPGGEYCVSCDPESGVCNQCFGGWGLVTTTTTTRICTECSIISGSASFSNGTEPCKLCSDETPQCAACNISTGYCTRCNSGYGYSAEEGTCTKCIDGLWSTGSSSCLTCVDSETGVPCNPCNPSTGSCIVDKPATGAAGEADKVTTILLIVLIPPACAFGILCIIIGLIIVGLKVKQSKIKPSATQHILGEQQSSVIGVNATIGNTTAAATTTTTITSSSINNKQESNNRNLNARFSSPLLSDERFFTQAHERLEGLFPGVGGYEPKPLVEAMKSAGMKDVEKVISMCFERANSISAKARETYELSIEDCALFALYTYHYPNTRAGDEDLFMLMGKALVTREREALEGVKDMLYRLLESLRKLPRVPVSTMYAVTTTYMKAEECGAVGKKMVFHRFMSACLDFEPSLQFITTAAIAEDDTTTTTTTTTAAARGTVFVLKNSWGYYIQPFSFTRQREMLIEPEMEFKIIGIEEENGIRYISLENRPATIILSELLPPPARMPANLQSLLIGGGSLIGSTVASMTASTNKLRPTTPTIATTTTTTTVGGKKTLPPLAVVQQQHKATPSKEISMSFMGTSQGRLMQQRSQFIKASNNNNNNNSNLIRSQQQQQSQSQSTITSTSSTTNNNPNNNDNNNLDSSGSSKHHKHKHKRNESITSITSGSSNTRKQQHKQKQKHKHKQQKHQSSTTTSNHNNHGDEFKNNKELSMESIGSSPPLLIMDESDNSDDEKVNKHNTTNNNALLFPTNTRIPTNIPELVTPRTQQEMQPGSVPTYTPRIFY